MRSCWLASLLLVLVICAAVDVGSRFGSLPLASADDLKLMLVVDVEQWRVRIWIPRVGLCRLRVGFQDGFGLVMTVLRLHWFQLICCACLCEADPGCLRLI